MHKQTLVRLSRSGWVFPAVLFAAVCLLTICKISGSSVGMYNKFFYGTNYHDKNLISGEPRSVRSDEWLVVTPMTVSQKLNGLKAHNPFIGETGQDMSAVGDAPHATWDEIFSPQNWSFFLLPVEFAFAFKWWFLGLLLIVSCYFFILAVMPGRRWFAIFVSLALFFAPYFQWWYQTITLVTVAYGFMALTAWIKFLQAKEKKPRMGWAALLGYSLLALVMAQYPPFVIPVLLAVIAAGGGYYMEQWREQKATLKRTAMYLGGIAASIIAVFVLFVLTRLDALKLEAGTEYPGKRAAEALQLDWLHFFGGFLSTQLQSAEKAAHYFSNQSEASNFIMIAPFLLIPSGYILWRSFRAKGKERARHWSLLFLNILLVIFAIRFTVEITGSGPIASLLKVVPNNRILLGIGFIAFLQFILLARDQEKYTYPVWVKKGGMWLVFWALVAVGMLIRHQYHGYITSGLKILVLAGAMAALYRLFVTKRILLASMLLLALSVYASGHVNPLYRGLSPLINSPLTHAVKDVNNEKPGTWIVLDSLEYNSYLPAANIKAISGVYQYPQFDLWKKIDPTGADKPIYNRYAQAVFSEYAPSKLYLIQNDWFEIKFDGCDPFVQQQASYILSVHPTSTACLTPVKTLTLPGKTFYIYKTGKIHE
jgi:hypothetical protein